MRLRWLAVTGCLAAVSIVAGGCGGGGGNKNDLTIYSSLPLQGANRPNSVATINGAKLALKEHNGKVGKFNISYKSLDDSTAEAGKWDAGQVSANARKAAGDDSTIAYIGEFNSGASAISIPILNKAGIGQISPSNTAVGLTAKVPGSSPGEPDKYYPTGKRTYTRVVPKDTVQGAADAQLMKDGGCTKAYILNDKEVYGAGLAKNTVLAAQKIGLSIAGNTGYDPKASNYRSLGDKVKSTGADCVMFSAIVDNNAAQLAKDVAHAVSNAKLFIGPDGVAIDTFTNPSKGGVPADVGKKFLLTVATLDPSKFPPAGQKFFEDYKKEYKVDNPAPYAIYGYEAMSLALDAIKRAGADGNDRAAVVKALFATKDRASVLGTYSIDKNGDTTLTDYGVYKVGSKGELTFDKVIHPKV